MLLTAGADVLIRINLYHWCQCTLPDRAASTLPHFHTHSLMIVHTQACSHALMHATHTFFTLLLLSCLSCLVSGRLLCPTLGSWHGCCSCRLSCLWCVYVCAHICVSECTRVCVRVCACARFMLRLMICVHVRGPIPYPLETLTVKHRRQEGKQLQACHA